MNANTRGAKALVLVVEDNEEVRSILTMYLRRNGYSVAEAADGFSALESFHRVSPDLVLLDVLLPRLDGIGVLKKLRETPRGFRVPVVMMSAVLQVRDLKAETARLNVSSILQKPFQMRTILDHVEKALHPKEIREPSSFIKLSLPKESKGHTRLQMVRRSLPAEGTLEDFPIPEILHSIFVESRTGLLRIFSGTIEKRVFLQNGLPVYAESSIPEETLGAHLVRAGRLSAQDHRRALEQMTFSGRHFGEILLKLDLIGPHELFTELETHLTQKVISTFGWFEGRFVFSDGDSWKDDVIVARMKPGRILFDGIQRFWSPRAVSSRLRITQDSRTFPLDASPYSEDQLSLSTQETRVLQMVRRGLTVADIIEHSGNIQVATTTLYALFLMEHLGFVLPVHNKNTSPAPVSASSPSSSGLSDPRSKELLAEYLKLRTVDYFKLLGIGRDASAEEIENAFRQRQSRYHPDALTDVKTGLVHEKMEELYIRILNGYRTLIDPQSKQEYIAKLDAKAQGSPLVARSKTGSISTYKRKAADQNAFEEGFSALRAGQFEQALTLFQQAQELNAKPRYQAYIIWTEFLMSPRTLGPGAEKRLLELMSSRTDDALYPYLLGNIALRSENPQKAIAYFERTVEIDPQHIDAARQLRLLRMRQRPKEGHSGVFEIFKKKK